MPLVGRGRAHVSLPVLAIAALGELACYRVPEGKTAVSDVTIEGTSGIDKDELEDRIATRESSRFLGLFPGFVYEYEVFDRYALGRDLARIERYLKAKGYYEARVYAARVVVEGNKVKVQIEVEQGPPVLVTSVGIAPSEPIDPGSYEEVREAIAGHVPIGGKLDEDELEEAEKAAERVLTANGYAAAEVARRAEVDLATQTARLYFTIDPGPLAHFGSVTFEGLGSLPEDAVRRIFGVVPGALYSSEALDDGRQALLELGVFASVDVEADLSAIDGTNIVPVVVKAQPAKIRSILLGAGLELDSRKTDVHVQVGWQSGNFLGGLRRFDVRFKPGLVLYPTRFPDLQPPDKLLYEQKVQATLRQPALFEKRTTGLIRGEYNMAPVLLPQVTENVLGYHELRAEVGVERTFLKRLFVAPEYGFQANFPFDYVGTTEGVEPLYISYVEVGTQLDYRDDPVKPRKGFWLGNQLQLAGGVLGGDATDIRVQPDARALFRVSRRITLALRTSVGFLFPVSYGQAALVNFRNPGPSRAETIQRDYQLLFFRGFFAGGPTSNRGYPLRGIGPHDAIPYLSPAGQSATAFGCNPEDETCRLPTGGFSLWEANAELRFVVGGPVAAALFCDAADVSPFPLDIRLNRPHLSCGGGARYDTPVGPIRLDVGYRIPGLQFPEGDPFARTPDTLLGLPIAIAFGIGEAF